MKAPIAAPAAAAPRFDVNALGEFAGEQVFVRGQDYHNGGAVQFLALEPDRMLATVSGTENYTVTLNGGGLKFEGSCSCPAFAERGVAVALAVNAAVIDEEPGAFGSLSRIRAIGEGGQVICLPGTTLYELEKVLDPLGRNPHSVIGSSCIGASVFGGVCNNSGGALIHRGPAFTPMTLFAQIDVSFRTARARQICNLWRDAFGLCGC